ncbi:beta family protein [Marinobacter sp.]|uniref:beta family protein n=1 Tax=Marinobacter sp. TaxID=50741 RepID=UPI003A946731
MIPTYIPILKGKKGEFDALKHTNARTAQRLKPLFELPAFAGSVADSKRFKDLTQPTVAFINEFAVKTADVWTGRECFVDARHWAPNATLENGEHVLSYAYSRLAALDVQANPVVNYDVWDDPEYQEVFKNAGAGSSATLCIRLETDALDDLDDPDYFIDRLEEIIAKTAFDESNICILIDFRDTSPLSVIDMQSDVEKCLAALARWGFAYTAIAGSSIPTLINDAVEEVNSTGFVTRKEMLTWKAIKKAYPSKSLVFSDYAIRNPNAVDDVPAPHANGKIRYTITNQFFVVRGHSLQFHDKGKQYHRLSAVVANSSHYMGRGFSYGDEHIYSCAKGEGGCGNSTTRITIDTTHHLKAVTTEIFEFTVTTVKDAEESR